jgi:hypothetical protein
MDLGYRNLQIRATRKEINRLSTKYPESFGEVSDRRGSLTVGSRGKSAQAKLFHVEQS